MTAPRQPSHSASRDLQRYSALFASRTQGLRSSAVRDMMAITARPEVISLAGGLPDTSTFPPATFAALGEQIAEQACARALQYGPTDGVPEVKECIAEVMAAEGMQVAAEDLLVTTGGQQGIDLVARTLIDPGDVIIAEGPTYPGAVPSFAAYQAEVVQIEMDEHGMRIELLEQTLEQLDRERRAPKFIYTIPSFQNPAGVTMSPDRRRRLVEIAHERELLVLEDNPYGLLTYEGELPRPLFALDGGVYVMYLGTFSKILSPGLRVGWLAAPPPVLDKLNIGKQGADLCSSTLSQLLVKAYFDSCDWRGYVGSLIDVYRARRDAMLEALERYFPAEASWTVPAGGLFVWATLPDYIDTSDLLARSLAENVAFVPGEGAYLDSPQAGGGRGAHSMRLNFSAVGEDRISEGIRRIGAVIEEQVGLYGTLTGGERAVTPAALEEARQARERGDGARIVEIDRRRRAGGEQ